MNFLMIIEQMETEIENVFNELIRRLVIRKEALQRELDTLKHEYANCKSEIGKRKEQILKQMPEDISYDVKVAPLMEKLRKELTAEIDKLTVEENMLEGKDIKFCIEEESLMNHIQHVGRVSISVEHLTPHALVPLNISLPSEVGYDEDNCFYYVVTDVPFLGITLNSSFVVINKVPLNVTNSIRSLALSPKAIYLSIPEEHSIVIYNRNWELLRSFGNHGCHANQLDFPLGLSYFKDQLYVCDACNNRIQIFKDEKYVSFLGYDYIKPGRIFFPLDITVSIKEEIYILHRGNPSINVFNLKGELIRQFGSLLSCEMLDLAQVCVTTENYVIITDFIHHKIYCYKNDANLCLKFGGGNEYEDETGPFSFPLGVTFNIKERLIILCDRMNNQLQIFSLENTFDLPILNH